MSTGLAYLIVPVRAGALARVRPTRPDMGKFVQQYGAQFCYFLDVANVEGRTWNNDGIVEDVATGSAAGCVAAYLLRHGRTSSGESLQLHQGQYLGRPSRMLIRADGTPSHIENVSVTGEVSFVGAGTLESVPSA